VKSLARRHDVLGHPDQHVMTTGKGFHVAWPKNRALSADAVRVRNWLAAQA